MKGIIDKESFRGLPGLVSSALTGASSRVLLKGDWGTKEFGFDFRELSALPGRKLLRRCLVPLVSFSKGDRTSPDVRAARDEFVRHGWDVRLAEQSRMFTTSLSIDSTMVVFYEHLNDPPGPFFNNEQLDIDHYAEAFEAQWSRAIEFDSEVESIFEDAALLVDGPTRNVVAIASEGTWDRLIQALSVDPALLYSLDPRKFEELIAQLLSREGADVQVTPVARDGGRDILAFCETPVGRHLYLVECKRFAPERPVGVGIVRQRSV